MRCGAWQMCTLLILRLASSIWMKMIRKARRMMMIMSPSPSMWTAPLCLLEEALKGSCFRMLCTHGGDHVLPTLQTILGAQIGCRRAAKKCCCKECPLLIKQKFVTCPLRGGRTPDGLRGGGIIVEEKYVNWKQTHTLSLFQQVHTSLTSLPSRNYGVRVYEREREREISRLGKQEEGAQFSVSIMYLWTGCCPGKRVRVTQWGLLTLHAKIHKALSL